MTNDKIQMTKEIQNSNIKTVLLFEFILSFMLCHLSFIIQEVLWISV